MKLFLFRATTWLAEKLIIFSEGLFNDFWDFSETLACLDSDREAFIDKYHSEKEWEKTLDNTP